MFVIGVGWLVGFLWLVGCFCWVFCGGKGCGFFVGLFGFFCLAAVGLLVRFGIEGLGGGLLFLNYKGNNLSS